MKAEEIEKQGMMEGLADVLHKLQIGEKNIIDAHAEIYSLFGVRKLLFGKYSETHDLMSVHKTEQGANDNISEMEREIGFYVDYVVLHD